MSNRPGLQGYCSHSRIGARNAFLCSLFLLALPAFAATTTTTTNTTLSVTSGGAGVTTVASGSVVTLTATVLAGTTPVTPGLVKFCDATAAYCTDIHILGTAQLTSAGTATLKFVPGIGTHSYKAVFVGTNSYAASSSSASALSVTGLYPTTTSIAQSGSLGNYTLKATVTSGASVVSAGPTGTVSFLDTSNSNNVVGTAALGSPALSFGYATVGNAGLDPNGIAVADFNGDGKLDAAVISDSQTVNIFLGNGDGTFTAVTATPATGNTPDGIATADFNGDGKPDLAIVNFSSNTVTILLGNGDGTFTAAASPSATTSGMGPVAIVAGDFNDDGIPDLVIGGGGMPTLTVLLGNGDGTFTAVLYSQSPNGAGTNSIAVVDFNGDGKLDLVLGIGSPLDKVNVLLGNGDGTFTTGASTVFTNPPGSVVVADFNNDGKADLAVLETGGTLATLLGHGDGTFATVTTQTFGGSHWLTVGDFNGDGKPDLAEGYFTGSGSGGGDGIVYVGLGNGDGTFTVAGYSNSGAINGAVAVGDFNGGGTQSILATNELISYSGTLMEFTPQWTTTATAAQVSPLGGGAHPVEASYPGDSNYSGSISATTSLTGIASTTLTLSANPTSSSYSQQVVLTATLSPYVAGTVSSNGEPITFYNGSTSLGTGTLSSGVATLNVTALSVGSDSLKAIYAGDSSLPGSTSNIVSFSVALATPAIAFTVPGHTYGDAAFTLAATSNSTGAIAYSVVSGPAAISGATLTITGAGPVTLQASQAATSTYSAATQNASFTIASGHLTLTANNMARVFGAANPAFTGSVTGAVYSDTFTESFSTTATLASIVGGYPITPSVTGTNLANYTVTATNGTLTISQAGTATTFALSNSNLTLTATVAALTSGTPTGSVGFYEGQTLVGTAPLSGGTANYTTTGFPAGDVVVTAQYSGDANFTQSASPPILVLSVTPAVTSLTAPAAGSVTDNITLSVPSGFTGPVTFACTGLPAYTTCTFAPSSYTFSGGTSSAATLLTIQTGFAMASPPSLPGRHRPEMAIFAALLGFPALLWPMIAMRWRRQHPHLRRLLALVLMVSALLPLASCGGSPATASTVQTPAGTSLIQIVVSGAGGLSQSTNVTLAVQ